MSTLLSPVREIKDLYFDVLPSSRVVKLVKGVRVGRVTVLLGANGNLYSPSIDARREYSCSDWLWSDSLMRALVKLGVISKASLAEHMEAAKLRDATKTVDYEYERLLWLGNRYGLAFKLDKEDMLKRLLEENEHDGQ